MKVKIADIIVSEGRREIDWEWVSQLAESITASVLLQPIVIDTDNNLVAGNHRLEAHKKLRLTEIEANIVKMTKEERELAEIDENLIRNEIHYTERGKMFDRRKAIYETLYPETKATKDGGGFKGNQHTKTKASETVSSSKPSFVQDTASKAKVSPRTVQQEIQIANNLTDKATKAVKQADIGKKEALALARMPEEQQNEVAKKLISGEAKSVKEAIPIKAISPKATLAIDYINTSVGEILTKANEAKAAEDYKSLLIHLCGFIGKVEDLPNIIRNSKPISKDERRSYALEVDVVKDWVSDMEDALRESVEDTHQNITPADDTPEPSEAPAAPDMEIDSTEKRQEMLKDNPDKVALSILCKNNGDTTRYQFYNKLELILGLCDSSGGLHVPYDDYESFISEYIPEKHERFVKRITKMLEALKCA